MEYEQYITKILYEAGNDGLTLKKLAMHVYNLRNGLFEKISYADVYKDTAKYIKRNSKSNTGIIEKAEKWGHYRIKKKKINYVQLLLNFESATEFCAEEKISKTTKDNSLSLF